MCRQPSSAGRPISTRLPSPASTISPSPASSTDGGTDTSLPSPAIVSRMVTAGLRPPLLGQELAGLAVGFRLDGINGRAPPQPGQLEEVITGGGDGQHRQRREEDERDVVLDELAGGPVGRERRDDRQVPEVNAVADPADVRGTAGGNERVEPRPGPDE